jgi:hypothetical protein
MDLSPVKGDLFIETVEPPRMIKDNGIYNMPCLYSTGVNRFSFNNRLKVYLINIPKSAKKPLRYRVLTTVLVA